MVEYKGRMYLVSHDVFVRMKEYQKAIVAEKKTKTILTAYNKAVDDWYNTKPQGYGQERDAWNQARPVRPTILQDDEARHFNIVYSIVKGKVYSQVEQKVREHNEPSEDSISSILKAWDISKDDFDKMGCVVYGS